MTNDDLALRAEAIGKHYLLGQRGYRTFRDAILHAVRLPVRLAGKLGRQSLSADPQGLWALRDVSFDIRRGEVVGIIGHNGAGKSTLLKILSRITEPTVGHVDVHGRIGSLLEVGTGFHPELSGRENIFLNGAILGMRRAEIRRRLDAIVEFAEVERFLDTPVKRYSSGMYVRLAFAVAAHLDPDILLVDEVLSVGDAAFQRKCLGRMGEVARGGRTILFVSHNLAAVQNLCTRAYLLERGRIVAGGPTGEVIATYLASLDNARSNTLADRRDREGDGRIRILDCVIRTPRGPDNAPVCGRPTSFALRYRATPPARSVEINLGFFSAFGEGGFFASNAVTGDLLDDLPAEGEIVCNFDRLPLLPGAYSVNAHCTVNGVLADWVRDAFRFQVTEGDFFGTGRLPPSGYGHVVAIHSWRVVRG